MERKGNIIRFNALDRFRYDGVGAEEEITTEKAPKLFQDVVDAKEKVGFQIQELTTANTRRSLHERQMERAELTREFGRLDAFLRDLGETAGDAIIELDLPVAM